MTNILKQFEPNLVSIPYFFTPESTPHPPQSSTIKQQRYNTKYSVRKVSVRLYSRHQMNNIQGRHFLLSPEAALWLTTTLIAPTHYSLRRILKPLRISLARTKQSILNLYNPISYCTISDKHGMIHRF